MTIDFRSGRPVDLDVATAYRILQLRVDVFVVEQECPYPELDGRDLERDALWLWAVDEDRPPSEQVLATLRLLTDRDGARRIGRVVTAPGARSGGVARELMNRAMAECGTARVVLDAQAHLADWYARFGFSATGPEYVEDGIPHIPMARAAAIWEAERGPDPTRN